ncbi:MAG TPA: aminotransferase class V-fold PLP-dependent enzyme [Candidatus Limnocylindrales bacterium]|nr:aminotransferase class V-fold PLP-dependent enzyme [Candidatus Limnocylindrales bacterium]
MNEHTTEPPVRLPAEPAETVRMAELFGRLAPSFDRYADGHAAGSFPAYVHGAVPDDGGPLPVSGVGPEGAIDGVGVAVEHGSRISAPGWLSFVTTGATTVPAAAFAASIVAGGQRYLHQSFNTLEYTGLRWLAELCGLPEGVTGVFSSGGSTSQLLGLGAARQAAFERRGVNVGEHGVPVGEQGRIYASEVAHRTVHRAGAVLGIGRQGVRAIPVDGDGRMSVEALDAAIAADIRDGIVPIAVVANAGVTDTGAVDRIDRVGEVARRHGTWLHVDGAYGLVANAAPSLRHLFAGLEDADSWMVDPHKWLATGLGIGAVYVRDEGVLTRAFAEGEAAYLEGSFAPLEVRPVSQFDTIAGRWADQSLELTAPPRGVVVWAILREIGLEGVIARVERHVGFARAVADAAEAHPRLELLMQPQLSIACFRYVPDGGGEPATINELNRRILERLRVETHIIPSSTQVDGRFAIRPCFINPRTTEREVEALIDFVVRFGDELAARG